MIAFKLKESLVRNLNAGKLVQDIGAERLAKMMKAGKERDWRKGGDNNNIGVENNSLGSNEGESSEINKIRVEASDEYLPSDDALVATQLIACSQGDSSGATSPVSSEVFPPCMK